MKIRIKNTLKAIRAYKTAGRGNYYDFSKAVQNDAIEYVGANLAFVMIKERHAGRPLTDTEAETYKYIYYHAVSDAMRAITNKVHKIIPSGIKNCRQFKIAEYGWYK